MSNYIHCDKSDQHTDKYENKNVKYSQYCTDFLLHKSSIRVVRTKKCLEEIFVFSNQYEQKLSILKISVGKTIIFEFIDKSSMVSSQRCRLVHYFQPKYQHNNQLRIQSVISIKSYSRLAFILH